ncbi:MAG: 2,3-bisphosphoglycerate-dependent phosphoglycerate mutase [Nitriliruptorales bacterium]|nr:2,3-bisphosphoglycerate-dependent phosphoglycerate mutase [Nitriliruptorales bacterium]
MSTLILARHGQSIWNAENRFTGWVDVPLNEKGREEAALGGKRLAAEHVHVDRAFTSTLDRAVETGTIILDALGQADLEQVRAWELNERFYGALTGRDKAETAKRFGAEQVHIWRRSYATPPPGGESLEDTTNRTLPYFQGVVLKACREVSTVLVSAHGNSLRAIVKVLDGLSDDQVTRLEIPTGVPIVYELRNGKPLSKRVLDS